MDIITRLSCQNARNAELHDVILQEKDRMAEIGKMPDGPKKEAALKDFQNQAKSKDLVRSKETPLERQKREEAEELTALEAKLAKRGWIVARDAPTQIKKDTLRVYKGQATQLMNAITKCAERMERNHIQVHIECEFNGILTVF